MPGTLIISNRRAKILRNSGETLWNDSVSLKTDLRSLQVGGEPEIHERVDLRAWTVLGVGGVADLLIRCRSADGLQRALDLLAAHGRHWLVVGSGSRLVPSDYGLRVPVVNLSGNLGLWELDMSGAVASGGANLAQVCRAAARTGLGGSRALMAASGCARPRPSCGNTASARVVLRARLKLSRDGLAVLRNRLDQGAPGPWQRQPRSARPVFVGPENHRAEAILAETRCLGMSVGAVRLSQRVPNLIRTARSARSADVLELVQAARQRAMDRAGVDLEPCLCFVDEQGIPVVP